MAQGHKLVVAFTWGCDACGSTKDIAPGDGLCARCKPKAKASNDNDVIIIAEPKRSAS